MINLNNLTPWEYETEDNDGSRENKKENKDRMYKTRVSFNFNRPYTIPHNQRAKTPILLEVLDATKQSLTANKNKRLSLDPNNQGKNKKKRKFDDIFDLVPLTQNQFPIEIQKTKPQAQNETQTNITKIQCTQIDHLSTLIQSQRKCLKLQNMPPLKIKSSSRRKSHSQLTLHNLHYFQPRKTFNHQHIPKPDYNSLNKNIFKSIKKKEISPAKKIKTVIAFQTVRIVRFDQMKTQKSPKKAYSKMRVDHFLDSLLQKMK